MLTILILTAILSIAFGVSSLLLGETKLSRESARSLRAYYAAEAGIERKLFEVRGDPPNPNDIGSSPNWCSGAGKICLDANAETCYAVDVTTGTTVHIKSYGCYKGTRRAIEVSY